AFQLDPISGLPSFLRLHAEEAGWMPRELALLPDRSQLFVASGGAPYLRRYGIGGNGVLTLADSLGTANYADATELAVAPEGHHLYLSSQATATLSVIELAIDSGAMLDKQSYDATLFAALVPPPGADPFASLHSFTIAPDGEHLLLTSNDEGVLLQLRRDPLSGLLGAEALVHRGIAGTQPAGAKDALVVTPDGRHLLVASASNGGEPLQLYARRAPDPLFALVEVDRNGAPAASGTVQGLLAPTDVAVSQDGDHVYVVSLADDSLAVFRRFPTQGLTEDTAGTHLQFVTRYQHGVGGVLGLDGAHRVRVAPDGSRVYVTSELGNSLAVFERDAGTGLLTQLQVLSDGAQVPALLGATGIAIDATHSRVYVAAPFDNAIAVFKVVPEGLGYLGEVRGGVAGVTGMGGITDLAITGDQRQLLGVSAGDNTVVVFN